MWPTCPWASIGLSPGLNFQARPKSEITHWRSRLIRMFLLLRSRCAIAGFQVPPSTIFSEWRCAMPVEGGEERKGEGREGREGGRKWRYWGDGERTVAIINGGRREPGNICRKSCRLPAPCSGGTNQITEWNHVYTLKAGENSFRMCGRSLWPRSKFTVVGLRDWLACHTLQLLS